MSDVSEGKQMLLMFIAITENLMIETEALWDVLRKAWPDHYQKENHQILEQAVEAAKIDPEVTGSVRKACAQYRQQVESGLAWAEALELIRAFPPKGKPN